MDDRIVAATDPNAGDVPPLSPLDLPSGDNLAAVRAADEWLGELGVWLSYYADAARRVGHEATAELHTAQLHHVSAVREELRRMWLGDDVRTHTIVDELRNALSTLNHRVEQLLGGASGQDYVTTPLGPPADGDTRPLVMRPVDQRSWESDDDYQRRVISDEGKALVRTIHAESGTQPPAWAAV